MRDMSENFGGNYGNTVIDPLSFLVIFACVCYLLTCRRSMVLVPFLLVASILPQSLRIVILTVDFSMIRIMVVAGLLRIFAQHEANNFKYTNADKLLIAFLMTKTLFATLLHQRMGIFIENVGFALDAFGAYFIARCSIRSLSDLKSVLMYIAILACVMGPLFWFEYSTSYNLFSVFKGVDAQAWVRNGEIRSRGPLPHAILAGCFWASFAPLFLAFAWKANPRRPLFIAAVLSILFIAISASSSTPMFSLLAGYFAWGMYLVRKHLRIIRWGVLITLITVHFLMAAPIWHLISRVSFSSSSTGYFRYLLIDSAVNHFNEWALIGTRFTGHWFYGAQDITNQFILVGVQGGMIPLIIFLLQITVAFKSIGYLLSQAKKNTFNAFLIWGLGASMTVHLTNFIGVSYFGQIIVLWYTLLGAISSLELNTRIEKRKREKNKILDVD